MEKHNNIVNKNKETLSKMSELVLRSRILLIKSNSTCFSDIKPLEKIKKLDFITLKIDLRNN